MNSWGLLPSMPLLFQQAMQKHSKHAQNCTPNSSHTVSKVVLYSAGCACGATSSRCVSLPLGIRMVERGGDVTQVLAPPGDAPLPLARPPSRVRSCGARRPRVCPSAFRPSWAGGPGWATRRPLTGWSQGGCRPGGHKEVADRCVCVGGVRGWPRSPLPPPPLHPSPGGRRPGGHKEVTNLILLSPSPLCNNYWWLSCYLLKICMRWL
jgi:hypothetical protein